MTEVELDNLVALLKDPYQSWPMYFTPERVLCKRAANAIIELREALKNED